MFQLATRFLAKWFSLIWKRRKPATQQQPATPVITSSIAEDCYKVDDNDLPVALNDVHVERKLTRDDIMFSRQQGKLLYKLPGHIGGRAEFIIEECKVQFLLYFK